MVYLDEGRKKIFIDQARRMMEGKLATSVLRNQG
jgi:hypothetical protein